MPTATPSPAPQSSHERVLHPGLGHPAAASELAALRDREQDRHDRSLELIHNHTASVEAGRHRAMLHQPVLLCMCQ